VPGYSRPLLRGWLCWCAGGCVRSLSTAHFVSPPARWHNSPIDVLGRRVTMTHDTWVPEEPGIGAGI
jgi:hypothetical protein